MFYEQAQHNIRLEWGRQGLHALGPTSEVVVIVDVLSFSTCVEVSLSRGATIFPFHWKDKGQGEGKGEAADFAQARNAILASKRTKFKKDVYSLAPSSLINIPPETRLVLPSPNGSTLSVQASKYCPTLTGCLRNCSAVANYVQSNFKQITLIPCGERWPDGSLRPALEDLIGAGAIISHLTGNKSPEARHAEVIYQSYANIQEPISLCSSGVELRERGFADDVRLASELDISRCVPLYVDEQYVDVRSK